MLAGMDSSDDKANLCVLGERVLQIVVGAQAVSNGAVLATRLHQTFQWFPRNLRRQLARHLADLRCVLAFVFRHICHTKESRRDHRQGDPRQHLSDRMSSHPPNVFQKFFVVIDIIQPHQHHRQMYRRHGTTRPCVVGFRQHLHDRRYTRHHLCHDRIFQST